MKTKLSLTQALLSSSIFAIHLIFPASSLGFESVVNLGNSSTTLSTSGYNFSGTADPETFNIVHGAIVNKTGTVSFDHNPITAVATLNFQGGATVTGSIGDYANARSINFVNLNTNNTLNSNIQLQTGNILAGNLNFTHDATLILETNGQIAKTNITTSTPNTGTVRFLEGGEVIGQIGMGNQLKQLDFLSQSGGKTLTLNNPIDAQNILIGNNGNLIAKDLVAVTNQINFTGDGLLTFNTGVDGSAVNGIITQNHQQGNLSFLGNSVFTGNLGKNTQSLNTLTAGVTGTEVQLAASAIYAKNIILSGDGVLTFNGVGPTDIFAPINPNVNNQGEIKTAANNTITFKQDSGQTQTIRLFTVSGNTVLDADFKATQTNISNNKTLTVNAGKKLESLVDGAGGGVGSLVFNDTNTSYAIMGSGTELASVSFTGGVGSIFRLKHDITAVQTNINNQEIVLIDNVANHRITGNLTLNNATQLTVPFGKTLEISGTGNVNFSANTTLNFNMANNIIGLTPALKSTGTVALNAASILNLVDAPKVRILPFGQTQINLIQDNSGAVLTIPRLTGSTPNLFVTMSLSSENNKLNLVLNRTPMAEITVQPHLIGVSQVFDQIGGQPGLSGELLSLMQQLDTFNDLVKFRSELASVTPLIDTATSETAQSTQQDVFGLFTQRIEDLRAENDVNSLGAYKGYNAGFINQKNKGVWLKLFANHSEQSAKDFINGFHATTTGLTLGTDCMLSERSVIGIGLAYANSAIHHELNEAKTYLDYYQVSVYGGVNMRNPWFINWMTAATYLNYEQNRTILFNNLTLPVQADYPGWQYAGRGEIGYVFGKLSFHTIPVLALTYSHIALDSYTETGAGTANQKVSHAPQDYLQAEFGVKFVNYVVVGERLMQPEAHVKTRYQLLDQKQQIYSQFVSLGPVYNTVGYQPTRESYNAGTSLTLFGEAGFNFSVSYDYDFTNNYHAHTGFVRLRYEW